MQLIDGEFTFPGAGALYIPPTQLHGGWGQEVSLHVVGEDTKPLPDGVTVLFFSYLENRFYRGSFALPHERIAKLFAEGFRTLTRPPGRGTYTSLVAGVAPGGAVAVWASGSDRQVEVFFGQAEAAEVDFHQAFEMPADVDRGEFVASSLAEAAESDSLVRVMMQRVPVGRWAAYRARYRWQPVFEGLAAPDQLAPVHFFNGERDILPLPLGAADVQAGRPVPVYLSFDDRSSRRSYELTFDEDETLAAFARAGAGGQPVELVFAAPPAGSSDLQVLVRGAGGTTALRHMKRETFGGR